MELALLQLAVFFAVFAVFIPIIFIVMRRAQRRRRRMRSALEGQREDSLRSINLMLQQMDYDAEVLRLLRHARNMRDGGRTEEFRGAIDTLQKRENDMLARVDRVREFEIHLRQRYGTRRFLARPGGDGDDETERIKTDIRTFISTLEKIRGGEPNILEEKISFFEKWVESPQRQQIYNSLKAMALFLEKGDSSELERLKRDGEGGNGRKGAKDAGGKGAQVERNHQGAGGPRGP